ncbi:AAA family ATPase [Pseudomonas japonica]|uniref:AAA family ATPase n=1 Tax=Pseudomonas japonica TaxID=256466 RepID=UPI0015E46703|nr:AAA family ATPase [Pseudomonas japonica]MBA1289935.1 AAA family ATPase [Pseudomonas japonica]
MTSLHADEAFLGHYQLEHDPFAARVPGFKFFPAQRKPVLGQLHHLARYSQLMLVVTGPHGSGKTLLRQALVASTNKQSVVSVVVSARGAGDAAGVLGQIAQGVGCAEAGIDALLHRVVQLGLTGQEVYLLVDDAEQLDESGLEALLELAGGVPEGRPHVFLFGEPSLVSLLEQQESGPERYHIIELQPYTLEETREYLAQRLEGAGKGIALFSNEQIADIHESSGGWPGPINQVARDSMIEAMIASRSAGKRPSIGLKMPKKYLLALSAVVVIIVAAAGLLSGHNKAPAPAGEQAQLPLGEGQPGGAQPNQDGNPAIEFAGNSKPLPLNGQPVMREPLASAAGAEDDDGAPAVDGSASSQPPMVTTSAPPVGVPAGPATTPVPVPSTPAPQPVEPIATSKPAPATKPAPAPAQQLAMAKPAPVKPVEKPADKPTAKASGSSWYTAQSPGSYVVQIFGTSSESAAQSYVREQGGEYRYFKKTLQGKPLYVVTYGSFANRAAAVAAIKNLPAKVQAGKPWPRTVASVQQELASAH